MARHHCWNVGSPPCHLQAKARGDSSTSMATAAPADTATAQEAASAVKPTEAMPEAQPDPSPVQQAEPASEAAPEQIPGAVKTVAQVGRVAQAWFGGAYEATLGNSCIAYVLLRARTLHWAGGHLLGCDKYRPT